MIPNGHYSLGSMQTWEKSQKVLHWNGLIMKKGIVNPTVGGQPEPTRTGTNEAVGTTGLEKGRLPEC